MVHLHDAALFIGAVDHGGVCDVCVCAQQFLNALATIFDGQVHRGGNRTAGLARPGFFNGDAFMGVLAVGERGDGKSEGHNKGRQKCFHGVFSFAPHIA